ncbi:Glutamate receptor ionotropic, kainate 2 [Nymphon striatum]|nr:Glutamate receptor ionotropic, kainate 2 [Nymphon striatum]
MGTHTFSNVTERGIYDDSQDESIEKAFMYAVKRANLLNGNLSSSSKNTYNHRFIAKSEVIKSHNSYDASKKVCQMIENGVNVIIGPKSSSMSPFVNSVLEMIHIPHIQNEIDTFTGRLDYSINIYPHWKTLSRIVTDLIRYKGWKKFTFIYEQNDAPLRMRNVLESGGQEGWKIEFRDLQSGYRSVLKELKRTAVTNVLLDCPVECIIPFLKQAQQLGVLTDYHNLIIVNLDFHTLPMGSFRYGQTNITGFRIIRENSPHVNTFVRHMTRHYSRIDRVKSAKKFQVKFAFTSTLVCLDVGLFYMEFKGAEIKEKQKGNSIVPTNLSCGGKIKFTESQQGSSNNNNSSNTMGKYTVNQTYRRSIDHRLCYALHDCYQQPKEEAIDDEHERDQQLQIWHCKNSNMLFVMFHKYVNHHGEIITACHLNQTVALFYSERLTANFVYLGRVYERLRERYGSIGGRVFWTRTKIEGLTGYINLEKGYRDDFDVEIVDLTRKGMIKTGHWTPDDGVVETRPLDHSLKDIYESMRLKTFKVSTILNEPYTMLKKSWQHLKGNDRYEGYCIDLINEIASKMKFRFTIHVVPDHQQGTKDTLTGDWTGMIGELVNGTADLAMGDLTITHERAQAVDFTMPFMNLGIGILFKRPDKTTPSLFSFLSPLALDVWLYMLAAYVGKFGVSVFLFILSRFSPYEWINPHPCNPDSELRENQFSLPNSLWFTGGSLMQQGTELMPKAWSTRMLAGTWWFFTLIMISSYTANLAAFLTSQRMSSPIESAEDLVRQTKIKYGSYAGGSTEMFFRKSKLSTFKRMWAFMESATPSVFTKSGKEGIQRVLDGNYAYLMEVTSIEYITERNCDLTQIGTPLDSKGYGIATPQGSPYQQLISSAILQLQEETRLDSLKLKWWKLERGGGSCKHFDEQQKSLSAAELSLSNVGGVFVVLLGGLAISCVIAMSEFIWETKKINESDRYSLCYEMFEELKQIVNCMGSVKPAKKEPRVKKKKKDSSGRVKVPHKPPERIPTRR